MNPSLEPGLSKTALRARLRERRRQVGALAAQRAADRAAEELAASDYWRNARRMGVYLATDGELPTTVIIERAIRSGIRLYLPTVDHGKLEFRPWHPGAPLRDNRYGIGEPLTANVERGLLDLILMPVVGWAADGSRLGMGGGYFDRYLADARNDRTLRIGLAYEGQRDGAIAALREDWDQGLDGLLSEQQLRRFRR